jgi:hypothetical protein
MDPFFAWMPHALAVFPSGQLLIAGLEYDRDRAAAMWPFTGIFASDGSLLKEIKLEDDETLRDMAASDDARVTVPTVTNGNRAVRVSQLEASADGSVYLMRWTNPAIVYAITAGGEVLRRPRLILSAPTTDPRRCTLRKIESQFFLSIRRPMTRS